MDLAEQTPPDVSLEAQRANAAADKRLRDASDRLRREREARGEPETVRALAERQLDEKIPGWRETLTAANQASGHAPVRPMRLVSDEGDRPTVAAKIRHGLVPERFWNPEPITGDEPFVATLDNYEPKTSSQQRALDYARHWLGRVRAGKRCMLALIGIQGTGKSHLLYACANALLDDGIIPYARPWYLLADELRYGGRHPITDTPIDAAEVRQTFLYPRFANRRTWFIDEVRPTAATAFDDTELTKFACRAYDAHHQVLITSNINPLSDVLGAPAASRFAPTVIHGPDARQA